MNTYVIKYLDRFGEETEFQVSAASRVMALNEIEDLALNGDIIIRKIISVEKAE